jgi:signal transduction histidine kinase
MPDFDLSKMRAHIHDLNNALAPILSYSELLMDDLEGQGEMQEFARRIHMAGQEAMQIAEELRVEAKSQQGKIL